MQILSTTRYYLSKKNRHWLYHTILFPKNSQLDHEFGEYVLSLSVKLIKGAAFLIIFIFLILWPTDIIFFF